MNSNHSSWQRTSHDHGAYHKEIQQSTDPLQHHIDPHRVHRCQMYRPMGEGWHTNQGVSYDASKPLVDSESDLKNITRKLSRDPNCKYQPPVNTPGEFVPAGYVHFPETSQALHNYSHISHPTCAYRELGVNRFTPLHYNPQERHRWEHPGLMNASTRLIHKDHHRCRIPQPANQQAVLPPVEPACQTKPVHPAYLHHMDLEPHHPLAHPANKAHHPVYHMAPLESAHVFGIDHSKC